MKRNFLFVCFLTYAMAGDHHHEHKQIPKYGEATQEATVEVKGEFRQQKLILEKSIFKVGEKILFVITNNDTVPHRFVIGDSAYQRAHAQMMKKMPDMEHHESNILSLAPGETKRAGWIFTQPLQNLEFACQEIGHYEKEKVYGKAH